MNIGHGFMNVKGSAEISLPYFENHDSPGLASNILSARLDTIDDCMELGKWSYCA
jgi:hypothetical protein